MRHHRAAGEGHGSRPRDHRAEGAYRFVDVTDEGKWYFSYVYSAYDLGLMIGVGEDRFAPNSHVTRAQMAMLLHRMAGSPAPADENPFTDVAEGKWYTNAVIWRRRMRSSTATATAGLSPAATSPEKKP